MPVSKPIKGQLMTTTFLRLTGDHAARNCHSMQDYWNGDRTLLSLPLLCFELIGNVLQQSSNVDLILLQHRATEVRQTFTIHRHQHTNTFTAETDQNSRQNNMEN